MHKRDNLPLPPPLTEWAAQQPVALFLDFDGTLVDIAETPDAILVPADLLRRLEALAARVDGRLALITGRSLSDIGGHLGRGAIRIVGSHGAEQGDVTVPAVTLSGDTTMAIASLAARWPDLLVETKPHGMAIHYRQEPHAEAAVFSVMDDIAEREGLAVRRGKMVVELGPAQANKGRAVARLLDQSPYAGATPVFIGDDITDEDGFAAAAAAGGHGILVGAPRPTIAHYRLPGTREVYNWLGL